MKVRHDISCGSTFYIIMRRDKYLMTAKNATIIKEISNGFTCNVVTKKYSILI